MHFDDHPALAKLRKAVIDQKKAFLPTEPEDPAMVDLHLAAIRYDQLVSQLVIAVLQGLDTQVTRAQLRQAKAAVGQTLSAAEAQPLPKVSVYRAYAARLDRMLALVEEIRGS